jgi:hypothetical protein
MTADSGDEAVANGRKYSTYSSGYCQQYVRGPCWEVGSLYGSAIEAWNGARYKHPGDRNPPKGAPCYYRGGQYGHAVISVGGGRIRSTDCTSRSMVSEVALSWPETSWGYTYLGWTEDINGVRLPIGPDTGETEEVDDMPLTDAEIQKIAKAVWKYAITNYDEHDTHEENRAEVMLAQTHARAGDARRAANKAANK